MKILSVNVSLPKEVTYKGRIIRTGIFKAPVEGRVKVKTLNIEGDGQADLIGHGGEQRAILVYSIENYKYWEAELNRFDFTMGQFGENFTVEGMLDENVYVGDRFRIGTALFEVSQPRVTCYKLAMKMGVDGFYNQILKSNRPGFYFRVLEEGEVGAGDTIEKVHEHPVSMSIVEMNRLLYFDMDNLDGAKKALTIKALSPGWRISFEDRLTKAKSSEKTKEDYQTFVVKKKVPESNTITSFYLEPKNGRQLPSFLPGQFLPLKLDIQGQYKPVYRTYSISSSPNPKYYRLTIKRELAPPNRPDLYPGVSSNYFHDEVIPGTEILTKSPRGKFYLDPNGHNPVVLLSAGVGLTPLISMLDAIVQSGVNRPTWFVHGARNSNEHAMCSHVRVLQEENDNVNVHIRYSKPLPEDVEGTDFDDIGHVDIELLKKLLPDKEFDFYLCGPAPFMQSLFNGLIDWGISGDKIHYEFFGPASVLKDRSKISTEKRIATATECCGEIEVTFSGSGVKTNWNSSFESILELAEASGLSPDYSCRSGICNTCVSKLDDGEVEYSEEPLNPPDPGYVLICCSKPKTNVIIDV
jgi:ferredoxin-NADP reductase/MOSC domain-containing protein YiiM